MGCQAEKSTNIRIMRPAWQLRERFRFSEIFFFSIYKSSVLRYNWRKCQLSRKNNIQ